MRLRLGIAVLVLASTPVVAQQATPSVVMTSPKIGNLQQPSKVGPSQKQEGDMLLLQNQLSERQRAIELTKKLMEKQGQGCEICKNVGK